MRYIALAFSLTLLSASAEANCEYISDKSSPQEFMKCVKYHQEATDAYASALAATRKVTTSPSAILELADFSKVRTEASNLSIAVRSVYSNVKIILAPETFLSLSTEKTTGTEPFMHFRALYASGGALVGWFRDTEPKIIELVKRFAIQGAVVTGGERIRPILEKPADALLAQKGMRWIFEHRCTEEDQKERQPVCATSQFPSEFKAYYGIEATNENVWFLGFLNRRDIEHRGNSAIIQKWALDIMKKLKEKS